MRPVWSQDSKIDCVLKMSRLNKLIFLHISTNSEKLKVNSMILGGCGEKWQ